MLVACLVSAEGACDALEEDLRSADARPYSRKQRSFSVNSQLHLVQLLLPTRDKEGEAFPRGAFEQVSRELTERFGGVTAYSRAPAEGRWKQDTETEHDDIVVVEVMDENLDRSWWAAYREELQKRFRQDVVIVRAQDIDLL